MGEQETVVLTYDASRFTPGGTMPPDPTGVDIRVGDDDHSGLTVHAGNGDCICCTDRTDEPHHLVITHPDGTTAALHLACLRARIRDEHAPGGTIRCGGRILYPSTGTLWVHRGIRGASCSACHSKIGGELAIEYPSPTMPIRRPRRGLHMACAAAIVGDPHALNLLSADLRFLRALAF